ncbi:hypothetical protein FBY03_102157 [Pseudomonas sp. SJZ079]|nr:hypothetical protein FBY03_102157 [Pseudomonas sp. SJZ079]
MSEVIWLTGRSRCPIIRASAEQPRATVLRTFP